MSNSLLLSAAKIHGMKTGPQLRPCRGVSLPPTGSTAVSCLSAKPPVKVTVVSMYSFFAMQQGVTGISANNTGGTLHHRDPGGRCAW